jgi:hypothetical protein
MRNKSTATLLQQATPFVRILRFVRWDRRSGNALAFADVEITLPNSEKRIYSDLKICKNGDKKPFLSEPQKDYVGEKLYVIGDLALRRRIEAALIREYQRFAGAEPKPAMRVQLALL